MTVPPACGAAQITLLFTRLASAAVATSAIHIGGYLRAGRRLVLITDCDSVPGAVLRSAEQEWLAGR